MERGHQEALGERTTRLRGKLLNHPVQTGVGWRSLLARIRRSGKTWRWAPSRCQQIMFDAGGKSPGQQDLETGVLVLALPPAYWGVM